MSGNLKFFKCFYCFSRSVMVVKATFRPDRSAWWLQNLAKTWPGIRLVSSAPPARNCWWTWPTAFTRTSSTANGTTPSSLNRAVPPATRWVYLPLDVSTCFCFVFYISTFITHSTLPRLVPFRRISTFFFRIGTNPGTFNHALFVVAEMCPVLELLSSLQSPPLFAAGFRCPSRVGSLWTPNARDVNWRPLFQSKESALRPTNSHLSTWLRMADIEKTPSVLNNSVGGRVVVSFFFERPVVYWLDRP